MAQNSKRPISPHLQVYKWGPAMAVSILDLLGLGCLAGETERMQRERLVRWAKASPYDRESMFCKVEQRISSEFPELKDFGIPDIVQEVVMESMQA